MKGPWIRAFAAEEGSEEGPYKKNKKKGTRERKGETRVGGEKLKKHKNRRGKKKILGKEGQGPKTGGMNLPQDRD